MVQAKKYLGQHFLINDHIAQKIIQHFLTLPKSFTIEIGCGTGVLTEKLLSHFNKDQFIAIDIDTESIQYLQNKYPSYAPQFLLEDFLHSDKIENILSTYPINIIGNFPYNISTQIMFKVLKHRKNVQHVLGMFQKEVAERICSPPGNKKYGILSVLLQTFYITEYLFTVNESSFSPPPKVKSAVISLKSKNISFLTVDENLYFDVVKTAFQQRRKTLKNVLMKRWPLPNSLPYATMRPEQLSYQQFIEITEIIQRHYLQK